MGGCVEWQPCPKRANSTTGNQKRGQRTIPTREQRDSFAAVAKSPIQRIRAVARERGWNHGILFDFTPEGREAVLSFFCLEVRQEPEAEKPPKTSGYRSAIQHVHGMSLCRKRSAPHSPLSPRKRSPSKKLSPVLVVVR